MKINWKVRLKNRAFWIAIIPALALLGKQVLELFGMSVDFTNISKELLGIIETVFVILAIIGVITDPTTKGISDSERALGYNEPNNDRR
ncbi:phage holin [Parvimonas micra]|uniref:Holin, phage phi LC3 family n=1 Tax=Parvimonas micra ATCC 33270 TaxID=411465 RepID=A8SKQ7_9FIRM|nr:phage holin [Parvimonas micra]EDP24170.1 holin, phage phi LC3 family [Parvimonas micra ATCC 33270]RSB90430.1 phage holin [Parvimonas micra]VEH96956.1 Small integral membrane protein [Parvimonas micra]